MFSFKFCVFCAFISVDKTLALSAERRLAILEIKTDGNAEDIQRSSRRISDINGTVMALGKCLFREHDEPFEKAALTGRALTEDDTKDEHRERILTAFKQEKHFVRNHVQRMAEDFNGFKEEVMKTVEAESLALNYTTEKITSDLDDLRQELKAAYNLSEEKQTVEINSLKASLETVAAQQADLQTLINQMVLNKLRNFENQIDTLKDTSELMHSCRYGWTENSKLCYKYFTDKVTYNNAKKTCAGFNAYVVDVQDEKEMEFVMGLVGTGKQFWLGLTDTETEGTWIWERTGARAQYLNWRPGQPDGLATQNCLIAGWKSPHDKWNDMSCSSTEQFVCKEYYN